MSISSVLIALTFLVFGLAGLGVLDLPMTLAYLLGIITGIVIFIEGAGLFRRG